THHPPRLSPAPPARPITSASPPCHHSCPGPHAFSLCSWEGAEGGADAEYMCRGGAAPSMPELWAGQTFFPLHPCAWGGQGGSRGSRIGRTESAAAWSGRMSSPHWPQHTCTH
ncbi:unnamed protein product, partial [Closterium sp. NIES-53]